jgi:hypothetical protein
MDKKILDLLLTLDDIEHCEYPPDFDYREAMRRVESLKPELDRIVGEPFKLDKNVQGASFFTDLTLIDKKTIDPKYIYILLGVRFSCFGNLFAIWNSSPSESISREKIGAIIKAVEAYGFVYVDEESLNEPYSGNNKYLQHLNNWWYRYFDYL